MSTTRTEEFESFVDHYIECLFWTEEEHLKQQCEEDGRDKDADFFDMTSNETLAEIYNDCANFFFNNYGLIKQACDVEGYSVERAGHDFWLTRNGHGAGFWDRGLKEVGTMLTDLCKAWSSVNATIGDDNRIYLE